jgi:hypothetical protein
MAMATLTEIIEQVATDLKDAMNVSWSAAELTRAVRWALHELSWATPRRAMATFAAQAGQREYSLDAEGISGALYIGEVWYPYTAGEPEYPPRAVAWRLLDGDTLFLDVDHIDGGAGVRVLYARAHTIEGLDGAAATSLSPEQAELVCLGAGGYAALQRAQEAIGQVNVTGQAPRVWRDWGQGRLDDFRARLSQLARREPHAHRPWTEGWGV